MLSRFAGTVISFDRFLYFLLNIYEKSLQSGADVL